MPSFDLLADRYLVGTPVPRTICSFTIYGTSKRQGELRYEFKMFRRSSEVVRFFVLSGPQRTREPTQRIWLALTSLSGQLDKEYELNSVTLMSSPEDQGNSIILLGESPSYSQSLPAFNTVVLSTMSKFMMEWTPLPLSLVPTVDHRDIWLSFRAII